MKKQSLINSITLDKNLNKLLKPIKNNSFKKSKPRRIKPEE